MFGVRALFRVDAPMTGTVKSYFSNLFSKCANIRPCSERVRVEQLSLRFIVLCKVL